jgi:hypothetical protein
MRYVGSRHPLAAHNPLRSVPKFRTRAEVFGPTKEEGLCIQLAQQLLYLPDQIEGVVYACKALSKANRMKKPMRRFWQGRAMRGINAEGARVRACRNAIAALEAQLLTLAHGPPPIALRPHSELQRQSAPGRSPGESEFQVASLANLIRARSD